MFGVVSQVWSAVSASPTTLAAFAASLSAFVALVATLTSPLVSFAVAKMQIRANVISTNRQAWINALRDDLAEMIEIATGHFYLRDGSLSGEDGFKYSYEQKVRMIRIYNRIRLRLNANEVKNQELISIVDKLRRISIGRKMEKSEEFDQAVESIIVNAQNILRAEWRRVKTGR